MQKEQLWFLVVNRRKILQKKTNVVNVGKDEIEPPNGEVNNEEDDDGLMNEESIENEAKDKAEKLIEEDILVVRGENERIFEGWHW